MEGPSFCSALMEEGYRGKAHVDTIHGFTLDFDNAGHYDFGQIRGLLDEVGVSYIMTVRGQKAHIQIPIVPINIGINEYTQAKVAQYTQKLDLFFHWFNNMLNTNECIIDPQRDTRPGSKSMWLYGIDYRMSIPEQVTCFHHLRQDQTVDVFFNPAATDTDGTPTNSDISVFDIESWYADNATEVSKLIQSTKRAMTSVMANSTTTEKSTEAVRAAIMKVKGVSHQTNLLDTFYGRTPSHASQGRNNALSQALCALASANPTLDPDSIDEAFETASQALGDEWAADPSWFSKQYLRALTKVDTQQTPATNSAWMTELERDNNGAIVTSAHNVAIIILNTTRGILKKNSKNLAPIVAPNRNLPWESTDKATNYHRTVSFDKMLFSLASWMKAEYGITSRFGAEVKAGLEMAFATVEDAVSPIELDLLRQLKWDGNERIGTWLIDHLGAENTTLNKEYGRRWMIAAVARVLEPGCFVKSVLLLQGKQDLGKTDVFKMLASKPEWFAEADTDFSSVESTRNLVTKWIVELGEFSMTSTRRGNDEIKKFFTKQQDSIRPMRMNDYVDHPRSYVICGTTNHDNPLTDDENTRWWPVKVTKPVDREEFKKVVPQLWAEAVHQYESGQTWLIGKDELELREAAAASAKAITSVTAMQEQIEQAVAEGRLGVIAGQSIDIMQAIGADNKQLPAVQHALKVMGWTKQAVSVRISPKSGDTRKLNVWSRSQRDFDENIEAYKQSVVDATLAARNVIVRKS